MQISRGVFCNLAFYNSKLLKLASYFRDIPHFYHVMKIAEKLQVAKRFRAGPAWAQIIACRDPGYISMSTTFLISAGICRMHAQL